MDKDRDIWRIFRKTEAASLAWSLEALAGAKGIQRLLFLNAHGVTTADENADFRASLLAADYLLRDGVGLEIGFRKLGLKPTPNLNGTDLIPQVIARMKDRKIAVWGSSEEALEKLEKRLLTEGFSNLAPMHHGFHEDDFYVRAFAETRPELVVLCMGMPRQEILAQKLDADDLDCLIICGGGWANFHSGHITRAPLLLQKLKLEWLHRLAMEPRRVGRRYTVGIWSYFRTVRRLAKAHRV